MGLDMGLYKKRLYKKPKHRGRPTKDEEFERSLVDEDGYVFDELAYWRKANHIHNWFVKNVQDGNDDCKYYEVSKEQLEELRDTCIKVLDSTKLVKAKVRNGYTFKKFLFWTVKKYNKEDGMKMKSAKVAKKLLPVKKGFFFGGYDYDEYYYENTRQTVEYIIDILEKTDFDKETVFYGSSW